MALAENTSGFSATATNPNKNAQKCEYVHITKSERNVK